MKKWIFDSFIYAPSNHKGLMQSHAQLPTPISLSNGTFKVLFSSRDGEGLSRPFSLDYCVDSRQITSSPDSPVLELGEPGTFDDCGIMPSSMIRVNGDIYLYYIGWNQRRNISYQLAIGLAISKDNGKTFKKAFDGPVLDRNIHDPIFCAAPCVHFIDGEFVMWYISATGWPLVGEKCEPIYLVKRALSKDGIEWETSSDVCIPYKFEGEALGRPWVTITDNTYHMWYSSRGSKSYRSADGEHYRLGYAASEDGVVWTRQDDQFALQRSSSEWDSEMYEYASVFEHQGQHFMLYNGNAFGRTGFGLARKV